MMDIQRISNQWLWENIGNMVSAGRPKPIEDKFEIPISYVTPFLRFRVGRIVMDENGDILEKPTKKEIRENIDDMLQKVEPSINLQILVTAKAEKLHEFVQRVIEMGSSIGVEEKVIIGR